LAYNNKYGDTATVAQKPDNALSLEKKDQMSNTIIYLMQSTGYAMTMTT